MLHDFPRNMLIVVLVNAFNDIISVFAVLHFDNDLIPGLQFILYNGKITEFAAVSIVPRKDNVAACYGIPAVFEPSGTERTVAISPRQLYPTGSTGQVISYCGK